MVFITCLQKRLDLTPEQSMATKALISFGGEKGLSGSVARGMLVGQEDGYSNQASGFTIITPNIPNLVSGVCISVCVIP